MRNPNLERLLEPQVAVDIHHNTMSTFLLQSHPKILSTRLEPIMSIEELPNNREIIAIIHLIPQLVVVNPSIEHLLNKLFSFTICYINYPSCTHLDFLNTIHLFYTVTTAQHIMIPTFLSTVFADWGVFFLTFFLTFFLRG